MQRTLSGGEAQRVKLATELSKRDTGKTFYILDEPTTGLHFQDISHFWMCCRNWWNKGNTVLVIEHNMDIIKSADYIVDLGPEGGEKVVALLPWDSGRSVEESRELHGAFLKHELN
jgi:excinuclease ABC subunit A